MDDQALTQQIENVLGKAGYETWPHLGANIPILCFEDSSLVGFVFIFPDVQSLLSRWEEVQTGVLNRYAASLRSAGDKAWNVYSVFTSPERASSDQSATLKSLEEDFTATRKIARVGVASPSDIVRVLQPLLPIQSASSVEESDYENRMRARLPTVPSDALTALLGSGTAKEILQIITENER